MNCREFDEVAEDLAHSEKPNDPRLEEALSHARLCVRCDARLLEEQELNAALREFAFSHVHLEPSATVEGNLRDAFQKLHRRASPHRQFVWIASGALSIAAATAIFVADVRSVRVKPPVPAAPVASSALSAPRTAVPTPAVASAQRVRLNESAAAPGVEAFVALPYSADISPTESASVVRVSLSGQDLASLGYPIVADASSEEVVADLVVGEDGTPWAIRVVR